MTTFPDYILSVQHHAGRALSSDWSINHFVENSFYVQSEFFESKPTIKIS